MAETCVAANQAFDVFLESYGAKYPKACECLAKDRGKLLTFYDFPAEHWKHLRTTNPTESVFATVRLRRKRTKGSSSRTACLAMVHQLMLSAAKRWQLLNGSNLLTDVIAGAKFTYGVKFQQVAA
jgi:transposase-like protein